MTSYLHLDKRNQGFGKTLVSGLGDRKGTPLRRPTKFVVHGLHQRPHVGNRIGHPHARPADQRRDVVGDDTTVELDFAQGAHHLVHVLVAIVDQRLGPRL